MTEQLTLRMPYPFVNAWAPLIELSERILKHSIPVQPSEHWPLLALAKKCANTTRSLAVLATAELWGDALVLGRCLFEVEVTVKWLLQEHTSQRIQNYILAIEDEKSRLKRKMEAGKSVSAQVLRDITEVRGEQEQLKNHAKQKPGRKNVRDLSHQVNIERLYDLPYWVSSIFAHAHVLSLSEWNETLKSQNPMLSSMFSLGTEDMPRWLVLTGVPTSAVRTYKEVDAHFGLGYDSVIQDVWTKIRESMSEASGGVVRFTDRVDPGDIMIAETPYDLNPKIYSPQRSKNDKKKQSN